MEAPFRFDEVHVISDLHLGGEKPSRQIFNQGKLLAGFIDSLAARPAERSIALVVNGDTVDFLAEPCARYFDVESALAKLEDIFGYRQFRPVWKALQRFVATEKRTLVLNLGNHDLELALPAVRRRLVEEISQGDDSRRGRIELAFDGTGFLCGVGGARVLCLHGNEVDTWNVTDFETLRQLGRDLQLGRRIDTWTPNAGSKLVVDVMNEVKRGYPFVDLLKPETRAVVPTLLALEPEMESKATSALSLAEVAARLAYDWTRRKTGFLSAGQPPAEGDRQILAREALNPEDDEADVDQMLAEIENHLKQPGAAAMDFVTTEEQERTLGMAGAILDHVRGKKPQKALRKALQPLQQDRSFDAFAVDDTYRALDKLVSPDVDFLVAGHTHLERALRRAVGPGFYFNSGTWVRLIELRPDDLESDANFEPIWNALKAGSMQALDKARKPKIVQLKPAAVSIELMGGRVRGSLNRVKKAGARIDLDPVREPFWKEPEE